MKMKLDFTIFFSQISKSFNHSLKLGGQWTFALKSESGRWHTQMIDADINANDLKRGVYIPFVVLICSEDESELLYRSVSDKIHGEANGVKINYFVDYGYVIHKEHDDFYKIEFGRCFTDVSGKAVISQDDIPIELQKDMMSYLGTLSY